MTINIYLIETFLAVVSTRSITQAANKLYVSQSTVSSRLQQLEEELGTTLIKRKKGIRTVEVTQEGYEFIPIAQRYAEFDSEFSQFKDREHNISLTIACPDSLNVHLFKPLYSQILNCTPHVNLRIKTHQSP